MAGLQGQGSQSEALSPSVIPGPLCLSGQTSSAWLVHMAGHTVSLIFRPQPLWTAPEELSLIYSQSGV